MSYLKPNTAGVYDIQSANIDTLYVKGKKFQDYISELVFEDQLEASEITEIKLLLEYLDTTGLNSAWTVTNSNVNETLRASITALQNKLANLDTTALTESSVLTNDNRNSVLKTAIDTATSDVTALTTRVTTAEGDIDNLETRMTTAEGDIDNLETRMTTAETDIDNLETRMTTAEGDINTAETNISGILAKTQHIEVYPGDPNNDETYHSIVLGVNMLHQPNTSSRKAASLGLGVDGLGFSVEYKQGGTRRVAMAADFGGEAIIKALDTTLQGQTVNIGQLQAGGGYETINIGGTMAHINIGSLQDPQIATYPGDPAANNSTTIKIGRRATLKNTWTYLQGNFYTSESRWEDLGVTDVVTMETAASWFSGFVFTSPFPYWLAWVGLSGIPNYRYSDIVKMANNYLTGGLTKNHAIETSNDISVKNIRVMDFTVVSLSTAFDAILARLVFQAFAVHGSHSIGSIWGRTNIYAGTGEVEIRVDGGVFDWAFKNAGNCNRVFLDNQHVEVVQCNGSGGTGRLRLVAGAGNIELSTGQNGVRNNTTKVMELTYQKQIIIGNDTTMIDDTYKMLIDTSSHANGVKVAKGANALLLNPDNVSSKSITLQSGYTGTTVNTLYTNADGKLFFNGVELGANVGGGGGGLEYYIPLASNVTNPAPNPTEQIATETYINAEQRTITQSTTAVATGLRMARYTTGIINKDSNPFVEGLQTIQQYVMWSENNTVGQLYGECWFQAEATGGAIVYERSYSAGFQTYGYNIMTSAPILAPQGLFNLSVKSVIFPGIIVDNFNNGIMTFRCRLEGLDLITENWNTLQTSTIELTFGPEFDLTTQTLTFTEDFVRNQTSTLNAPTQYRFALYTTSPNGNGHFYQANAGSPTGNQLAFRLGSASGTASIRVLLYNGVNAKQSITHTTTPSLIPIELPISPLYQIGAFNNGRLAFDIFMYQPSGAVNSNHTMRFFFGEGTISHIESTINEPPAPTPTLAQVLNSGATASQPIHMDGKAITGITTLEGSSGGNWNVKEITAGTNISVSSTSGNYTITNDAPTQEVSAGFGMQVAKSGTTATIINNAPVQNLTASSGIAISVDTPTRNATITNTGILGITAGSGLLVTTTNGVATITNTATAGSQVARDQLTATNVVGLVPHKLGHYAQNWTTQSISVQPADIFVSQDGKNCVYIPGSGSAYIQFSNNYGENWFNSNFAADSFVSICGTTTGEVLFVSKFDPTTGQAPNVVYTSRIYASYDHGQSWLDLPMERTPGVANTWYNRFINKIRCSSDASVIAASTILTTSVSGVANNGTVYISLNSGATWVVRNITAGPAQIADFCMSSNGAIMFAAMNGVLGGATDNGYGGIYRSLDFGETWTKVRSQIAAGSYFFGIIKCDATGRFLVACDQSQSADPATGQIQSSDDYGSNWFFFGDSQAGGATAAFVSPGGNFMITAHNTAYNSQIRYSTDYGKNWTTAYTLNAMMGTDTIRALASNHDGSLLLVGGSVVAAIYRSFEERGRLSSVVGSRDLTITPAFGGGYTLFNNPVETLWFSGGFEVTSFTPLFNIDFDWAPAGKIDLTQYNLRYEIECYWNTGTPSHAFPLLVINRVKNTDVPGVNDNQLAYDGLSGLTNWTNTINNGSWQGGESYNQTYRNRFFAGYFPPSTTNLNAPATDQIRQRTLMTGLLSLHKRPQGQAGITDPSVNARDILNKFHCDNYTTRFTNGMSYLLNSNSQQGIDYAVNHHRMDGTAIFPAESVWSYNAIDANSSMANGIVRLGFYLCDGFNVADTRARSGYYTYKIYRVRK